jgi:hypothetical protein
MQLRTVVFAIVSLSLVLPACGSVGGDGPTKPVNDFYDALEKLDVDKAAGTVCKQQRDDFKTGIELIFGFLGAAGDDAKIEINGLKLAVKEETDGEATVIATAGTIKVSIQGKVEETDLVDDVVEEPLKVIKEHGKWLICDEAFLMVGAGE